MEDTDCIAQLLSAMNNWKLFLKKNVDNQKILNDNVRS